MTAVDLLIECGSPFDQLGDDHQDTFRGHLSPSREMAALGFSSVLGGEDRIVFVHDSGWCLKVSHFPGIDWANRRELTILATLSADDRRCFAETYRITDSILIQRVYRVDVDRFNEFYVTSADIRRVQWRLRITDISGHNVGWASDGAWVFIDWAGKQPTESYGSWIGT